MPVALLVVEKDKEVQAHIGNGWEGMGGVNGLGCEDRIDFPVEIVIKELLLLFVQIRVAGKAQAPVSQLTTELLSPVILADGSALHDSAAYLRQLLCLAHAIRARGHSTRAVLAQHVCYAHHEEFVEVVAEDAEEFELLKQGKRFVQSALQYAIVELKPVDLAVDVQPRTIQIMQFAFKAGFEFGNVQRTGHLLFLSLIAHVLFLLTVRGLCLASTVGLWQLVVLQRLIRESVYRRRSVCICIVCASLIFAGLFTHVTHQMCSWACSGIACALPSVQGRRTFFSFFLNRLPTLPDSHARRMQGKGATKICGTVLLAGT